ncbi:uncharacterized protein LOC117212683 [Bombus bifarius]|uniref:Uncharacterized protein LOC117212683 n=1 Tax=Bombus bifarius TaxID=103933 RepID=A0A6P8MYB5_9HYME|nr:uncharacterized protein LOC117212683 [Bombus bifarius]
MRVLFVILFICLLAISAITGCRPAGALCSDDKDCCQPLICNPWARRCTKKMGPPSPLELKNYATSIAIEMRFLLPMLMFMAVCTAVLSTQSKETGTCSPWNGKCTVYEDCCRHLLCLTYAAKCVLNSVHIPGQDKRPIGNGPFPPGYPSD